jgi:hypothetical protein
VRPNRKEQPPRESLSGKLGESIAWLIGGRDFAIENDK